MFWSKKILLFLFPLRLLSYRSGFGDDCDVNPTTGNPHPIASGGDANIETTEVGNPHNSLPSKGNSHKIKND